MSYWRNPEKRVSRWVKSRPPILKRRHASDARTARWARIELRKTHRKFVTEKRKPIGVVLAVFLAMGVAAGRWLPLGPVERGFAAGSIMTAGISFCWIAITSATGTVARQMGIDAETWTATELRRLRRKRWYLLNGLRFEREDVDHVLIGHGRVLAIESKWSSTAWNLPGADPRVDDAAMQVRRVAERLQRFLATKGVQVEVGKIVVLWGPTTGDAFASPTALFSGCAMETSRLPRPVAHRTTSSRACGKCRGCLATVARYRVGCSSSAKPSICPT